MSGEVSRSVLGELVAAVQYRRPNGVGGWTTMAAFDVREVADRYAAQCACRAFEYRVVDLAREAGAA